LRMMLKMNKRFKVDLESLIQQEAY